MDKGYTLWNPPPVDERTELNLPAPSDEAIAAFVRRVERDRQNELNQGCRGCIVEAK